MKLKLVILLFLCSFQLATALSSNPVYLTASDDYHIVKNGDTVTKIAKKYEISERKLKLYNNLTDDSLLIGQKVYLTPNDLGKNEFITIRAIPTCKYHIAKKGETLTRIAKMYDLYVFDLVDFNNLSSFAIQEGQKIWLDDNHHISEHTIAKTTTDQRKNVPDKSTENKIKKSDKRSLKKLIIPTKGVVSSEYGMRNGRPHKGIDIAAASGTPIYAVQEGEVVFSGSQRGYGNVIIIEHNEAVMTVYAHNEANLVRVGDTVKQGQPIARVGKTGRSSGPHLHFEYRKNGKAINPRKVLPDL